MPALNKIAVFSLLLLSVVFIPALSSPATKQSSDESDDETVEVPIKTNRETRTFGFRLFDMPREWSSFQQLFRMPQFPQFSHYPTRQEVNWYEDDSESLENLKRRISDLEIGQRRVISYLRRLQAQLSSSKPGSVPPLPNVDSIIPQTPSNTHHVNMDNRMDSEKPTKTHNPSSHPSPSSPMDGSSGIFTMTSTTTSNSKGPSTMHTLNIDIHGPSKPTSPMSTKPMNEDYKNHPQSSSSTSTDGSRMDEMDDVSSSTSDEMVYEIDSHGPAGMMVPPESTHKPMIQKDEKMKDYMKDDKDGKKIEMEMNKEKNPMFDVKVNNEKMMDSQDEGKVNDEKKVRVGLKGLNGSSKKEGDDLLIEFNDIKRSL